ncbi:conserved hypothetical protein [Leptospira interrogans serovar Manilae]|uniref:Uncharacterized protein n=1 Tax=Leptospira interrogans serovar Manilae TaxID=214675 RepID=A0AAQ1NXW1_LEPIR|nr:conserved hypothetical protein [Leptospira interrogans serovar Manilae]
MRKNWHEVRVSLSEHPANRSDKANVVKPGVRVALAISNAARR